MTATDQSIRQHTSESAAKVIEILRQWKPKHDEYMAGIIAREASLANRIILSAPSDASSPVPTTWSRRSSTFP